MLCVFHTLSAFIIRVPVLLLSLILSVSVAYGRDRNVKPQYDIAALEQQVHTLINRERKKHGLTPLQWNEALQRVARGHSRAMAGSNFFSHDGPEGDTFVERYRKAGFVCSIIVGKTIHGGAENISQDNLFTRITYRNGVPFHHWTRQNDIAASIVRRWMESRGHKKNILAPHWTSEGIGIFITEDGKVFVTQNFC